MTDQTEAAPLDGTDLDAVFAVVEGRKDYLPEKTDAKAEEPAAEASEEPTGEEPAGDETPADADDEEVKAEAPKPKKTAQERFDELTRARREAEREAEYWKAKALQPTPQPAQEAQQTDPAQYDGRPDPSFYEGGHADPQYIEDLTDWKAEQAAARYAERQALQQKVQATIQTFESRKAALFPEGETEGLQRFLSIPELPAAVIEVVGESEIGPKIAEYLGDNPAELRRLEVMSPIAQARALTLIENRLTEPAKAAAVPPPKVTRAPEPPPVIRGSGGRFKASPDTEDFSAFEAQYLQGR